MTALVLGSALLAGCSTTGSGATTTGAALSYTDTHVHGVERPSPEGPIHLATHDGLWIQAEDGELRRVGPVIDLMGFSVLGPERFVASGHPGPGADLPEPVGLIESSDGGQTWSPISRGGESDFHLLAASETGTMGYDGAIRQTSDLRRWQEGTTPGPLTDLAVDPGTGYAVDTADGDVLRSTDGGQSWTSWPGTPDLVLLDWAGPDTVVGLTAQGDVTVSTDSGDTWETQDALTGPVQAMSAGVRPDGAVEVLIATDTEVQVLLV